MPRASTSWVCTGISLTSCGSRSSWSSTSSVAEEERVSVESRLPLQESSPDVVDVPASTPWPLVLAFGVMLLFGDRKSTRLNSSHVSISYAVFCLKKKKKKKLHT